MSKNLWKVYNELGKFRVVVTKPLVGENWLKILQNADYRVEVCQNKHILSKSEIIQAIGDKCDGVLGQLTEKWDEELFSALKKAGGRAYSNVAVGYDNVSVGAATKVGIPVGNTPGVLTETTSEFTAALTFAATRRVVESDKFMREGKYHGWLMDLFVGQLLQGKTVGIIGMGRIGACFALMMMRGFKMNCLYFDNTGREDVEEKVAKYNKYLEDVGEPLENPLFCKRCENVEDLLKASDLVSLHVSMNQQTKHLINKERLSIMKKNAILVNAARGPVIDENALVQHLQENPDFKAALDVYEKEPEMAEGLKECDNAVLVPHIASATLWTRGGMSVLAALNVRGILENYPVWNQAKITQFLVDDLENIPKQCPSIVNAKDLKLI